MRLSDIDAWDMAGFQNQLINCFILVPDVVEGGIREFVNNTDGPAFLERELVGLAVDGYR